jgi:hypothetical protein
VNRLVLTEPKFRTKLPPSNKILKACPSRGRGRGIGEVVVAVAMSVVAVDVIDDSRSTRLSARPERRRHCRHAGRRQGGTVVRRRCGHAGGESEQGGARTSRLLLRRGVSTMERGAGRCAFLLAEEILVGRRRTGE